jgi:hypothetical protein
MTLIPDIGRVAGELDIPANEVAPPTHEAGWRFKATDFALALIHKLQNKARQRHLITEPSLIKNEITVSTIPNSQPWQELKGDTHSQRHRETLHWRQNDDRNQALSLWQSRFAR